MHRNETIEINRFDLYTNNETNNEIFRIVILKRIIRRPLLTRLKNKVCFDTEAKKIF